MTCTQRPPPRVELETSIRCWLTSRCFQTHPCQCHPCQSQANQLGHHHHHIWLQPKKIHPRHICLFKGRRVAWSNWKQTRVCEPWEIKWAFNFARKHLEHHLHHLHTVILKANILLLNHSSTMESMTPLLFYLFSEGQAVQERGNSWGRSYKLFMWFEECL